jgi:hypothetical protein
MSSSGGIPGLPTTGTIPRLGQGIPGGAASVSGLPGGTGVSQIPGLPTLSRIPSIQPMGSAGVNNNTVFAGRNTMEAHRRRLEHARQVLATVQAGRLEPKKAASLLENLTSSERHQLTQEALMQNAQHNLDTRPQLQALKVLGHQPSDAQTAAQDPARGRGVGSNLAMDAFNTVVGMPAGIALAGKAAVEDVANAPGDIIQGKVPGSRTYKDVVKPVAQSYAQEYGPALHGDFSQIEQHPLMPILDAATLLSGGLGAAGRVGEAADAIRAGRLTTNPAGLTKVGDRFTVQPQKNGMFSVREGNNYHLSNLPSHDAAVAAAKKLQPFGANPVTAFLKGGGDRGRLIDRYDTAKGNTHEVETQRLMSEVADVLDNPNLRVNRRTIKQVAQEVWGDLQQTFHEGKLRPAQISAGNAGFLDNRLLAHGLSKGETALRETSDLVRAGAIYLRPAYLPNNWVGNTFMNMAHQGVLAPVNLAKSLVVDKYIGKQYTAAMDKVMGQNAAEVVTAPRGRGYVASITQPVAHSMGMVADQPFRRAAFLHEARRAGYSKLSDVQKLFDRATSTGAARDQALRDIATIGRRAQEEIVKFGEMNPTERSIVRNLIFVYSWVRGASRYAARFPLQHPIQANAYQHLAQDVGNPWLAKNMGGEPFFMAGSIPVGHDKNGNPIVINPFSLNPLGTAVDVARAAVGTAKVIRHPKSFNKFVDSDIAQLTNPLIQAYLTARGGGKPVGTQLKQTIAPLRLIHDLQHPGTGSIYPTSRIEALGHYVVGSMFPRVADQKAITASLERENRNNPIARIGMDMATLKSANINVPPEFVAQYQQDLVKVQEMKDFQSKYAGDHGQSGFRNLPPKNKADAAIKFLVKQGRLSPSDAKSYQQQMKSITNDADLSSFANDLFNSLGIGQYKRQWDELLRQAHGQELSRARG